MGICDGRVVIVTGAGRGIGRGHAIEFARQGAKVVVNDLGAEVDGSGSSTGPAGEVVDEIRAMGGEAIANGENVADWEGAQRLVNSAVEPFGKPEDFDRMSADNIAPLVVWLGSNESKDVTGNVFLVSGGTISVAEGWRRGPTTSQNDRWDPAELGKVVPDLLAQSTGQSTMAT